MEHAVKNSGVMWGVKFVQPYVGFDDPYCKGLQRGRLVKRRTRRMTGVDCRYSHSRPREGESISPRSASQVQNSRALGKNLQEVENLRARCSERVSLAVAVRLFPERFLSHLG